MTIGTVILFGIAFAMFVVYDILVNRRVEKTERLEDITKKWDKAKSVLTAPGRSR